MDENNKTDTSEENTLRARTGTDLIYNRLKALVIIAPASVGRNLYMTLSRVSSLDAAALGGGRRSTRDSE
jgi:hypothetical protein